MAKWSATWEKCLTYSCKRLGSPVSLYNYFLRRSVTEIIPSTVPELCESSLSIYCLRLLSDCLKFWRMTCELGILYMPNLSSVDGSFSKDTSLRACFFALAVSDKKRLWLSWTIKATSYSYFAFFSASLSRGVLLCLLPLFTVLRCFCNLLNSSF